MRRRLSMMTLGVTAIRGIRLLDSGMVCDHLIPSSTDDGLM